MGFKVKEFVKAVKRGYSMKEPEILLGLGISGSIIAMVQAGFGTYKAVDLVDKKKKELGKDELTPKEIIETTWFCYLPAAVIEAATIGCLLGSNSSSNKKIAAATAAFQISESWNKEYTEKVKETIGEKKESEIRDEIEKDRLAKRPVISREVFITGNGGYLCSIFGRYFRSDIDTVKQAFNKVNYRMQTEHTISKSELCYELDITPEDDDDKEGWNIGNGLIEPRFTYIGAPNGEPCMVISFYKDPSPDYCSYP